MIKQCTKCGMQKPLDKFYIDKRNKSGYGAYCKKCVCDRVKKYNAQKVPTPDYKKCCNCHQTLHKSEFWSNKGTKNLLSHACIECSKISQHLLYLKPEQQKKRHKYNRSVKRRFSQGISTAKRRNYVWELDLETYSNIISKPCTYCTIYETNGAGYGLDRIDNNLGYTINNVVPCCSICNTARNDNFTVDEMKVLGQTIRQIKLSRKS